MRFVMIMWILGLLTNFSSAADDVEGVGEPFILQDIQFAIDHNTAENHEVAVLEFEVHERANAALGEASLEWNPAEFLKETRLVRIKDGHTPTSSPDRTVALTIGEDAKSDFVLEVINRGRIRKGGEPVKLSLRVPRPNTFLPGIYQGQLKFRFSASEQINQDILGYVNFTVAVRGLQLVDFRFKHAVNGQVRFGNPADIEVTIDTFDCELNTGEVQFSQQPTGSVAPQSLSLSIPFSKNAFRDPKLDLKPNSYPASWSKSAFWTETSTASDIGQSARVAPTLCAWKRRKVELHLGECNDLGTIRSQISWPQAENAPNSKAQLLTKEAEAKVIEGLKAVPRLAFRGEPIQLTLASRVDLGPTVAVIIVDDEKKNPVLELKRSGQHLNADGSKINLDGQTHQYHGSFSRPQYGTCLVRFPSEVVEQHPSLRDLEHASPEIRIWLALQDTTQDAPLRVFASATPFWWGWKSDPFKGAGWREKRLDMVKLDFDKSRLSDVSVKLISTSARPVPPAGTAPQPELDPLLTIDDPRHPAQSKDSGLNWTGLDSSLALGGEVSFLNHAAVQRQPVIGRWKVPYRMQIDGTTNGAHVVRLIELTVPVEVTTEWVCYRQVIGWVIGALILGAVLFTMYRRANPRLASHRRVSVEVVKSPQHDGLADFLSTAPPSITSTSETKKPAAPQKRTTSAPPPRRTDDIDDFSK